MIIEEPALVSAGQSLDELELEESRRTWTIPVHHLPIEILSIIFVHIARITWKSPFVLGRVCRYWRESVLQTPEAWSMVKLNRIKPGLPISTILTRSEPYPVDLVIINYYDYHVLDLIPKLNRRIKYMSVIYQTFQTDHPFTQLTTLVLIRPGGLTANGDPKALLDQKIFPNLRLLSCGDALDAINGDIPPDTVPPPIRELAFVTRKPDMAIKLLQRLSSQLVALHMQISNPLQQHMVSQRARIVLPRLNTLAIIPPHLMRYEQPFKLPFAVRTPILSSYIEAGSYQTHNIHKDTRTVTRLAFSGRIDFGLFPNLQVVIGSIETMTTLLQYLEKEPEALPDLARVTFQRASRFEERLRQFNRKYGRSIVANIVDEPIPFLSPLDDWDINAI